jgi:hypothetical protein
LKPSLKFGEILKEADEAQDNLEFTTLKDANLWLNHKLNPTFMNLVRVWLGKLRKW